MSAPPEFEALLKEVVSAKRLSASKMAKLTDIALAGMENDTQLVSMLYRTHKALPAASKISSLYVFDALARAARSHVVKTGIVGDIHAPVGNAATFLLKVEGVLDGLFQDLMSLALPEAQVSLSSQLSNQPVSNATTCIGLHAAGNYFMCALSLRSARIARVVLPYYLHPRCSMSIHHRGYRSASRVQTQGAGFTTQSLQCCTTSHDYHVVLHSSGCQSCAINAV